MTDDATKIYRVVVASLRCLADASHSPEWKQNGAGFYVVAGYVGHVDAWRSLEAAWRDALAEEQIREFHATDCESGRGEFAHLRGRQHDAERRRLQARFIGIIKRAAIWGLTAQVALAPFWKYRPKLLPYMAVHLQPLVTPPVYGGQAVVNMATQWIEWRQLAADERIDYIFDENLEFQGRIEDLYKAGLTNRELPRRHRHGELCHANKRDEIALQAADVLAYEEYRYLAGTRDRWQREMLHANSQVPLRANMNSAFMRMMVHRAKLDNKPIS